MCVRLSVCMRVCMHMPITIPPPLPLQRTAAEVSTLLSRSESMQAGGHPASPKLKEVTAELQALHSDFESRFSSRKRLLESTIDFYKVAQEVGVARGCGQPRGAPL